MMRLFARKYSLLSRWAGVVALFLVIGGSSNASEDAPASSEPISAFDEAPKPAVVAESSPVSASDMPILRSYTKTAMSVYQGDKVELRAEVEGEGLRYRWVKEDKVICAEKVCQIDTKAWGLGKHLLVMVVFNKAGSRSVKYNLYVLAPAPDMEPRNLTPQVVEASAQADSLREDDLFVQSLAGAGYSYTKQTVHVIGRQQRPLTWDEKVRTTANGLLVLGRGGREEHFVLPSTLAVLSRSDAERRLLTLQYGALRSRTLQDKDPAWSTLVGDWLQVDASGQSDVIVAKAGMEPNDPVEVSVLRGFARVVVQPASKDSSVVLAAKEVVVPAGLMVRVTRGSDLSTPLLPTAKLLGSYVRRSTPHYLPESTTAKQQPMAYANWVLDQRERNVKGPSLITLVDKYLAERDPVAALEALLGSEGLAKDDYEIALRLGRAYEGLFLHKEAFKYYKMAIAAKPRDFVAPYRIGFMSVRDRHWKQAVVWLTRAERLRTEQALQELHYYRGVAYFWLAKQHQARADLTFAVWEGADVEIADSARQFLAKLDQDKWWGLYVRAGVLQDGNALRLPTDVDAPEGMKKSGLGYLGAFGIFGRAFHSDSADVKIGFDIERRGYLDSGLKDVEIIDESLYVENVIRFGGDVAKPDVELRLRPFVRLFFVGNERADDVMGADVGVKLPATPWQPELSAQIKLHQDPIPGRDDLLDPVTLEPVVASERSNHQTVFTLGATALDNYPGKLGLGLGLESVKYRNVYVQGDNFSTTFLTTKYTHFLSSRSIISPTLQFGLRNYGDSLDSRKDTRIDLLTNWRYYYYAGLYQDLWASYLSQKSSRDTSTFSRLELGLAATWEL